MKKTFKVKGLTCINCANKIEKKLLLDYDYVSIDIINQTITIESNGEIYPQKISTVLHKYEPSAKLIIPNSKKKLPYSRIIIIVGLIIFLVLLLLFGFDEVGIPGLIVVETPLILKLLLFLFSYLLISHMIIYRAIRGLLTKDFFNENTLMLIASICGFILRDYPEAILVMLLYQFGEFLTNLVILKSKDNIYNIIDQRPKKSHIIVNDVSKDIESNLLKIDDIVLIKSGENIGIDGIIIEGHSFINTYNIDGESTPKEVNKGSLVYAGTTNIGNTIIIKATNEYSDSVASKIIEMIGKTSNKTKTEKFLTRFSRLYTKIVIILALIIALIVPLIIALVTKVPYGKLLIGDFGYLHRGLVFLVISCPCALVLSIPFSFFVAIGIASKNKVLVRSSVDIEILSKIKTFIFDKTGTLTKGSMTITKINNTSRFADIEFVRYFAIAEYQSIHPLAKIILKMNSSEINSSLFSSFEEIPLKGVSCVYDNTSIFVGNRSLMNELNIKVPKTHQNSLFLVVNNEYLGFIEFQDEIKENAKEVVSLLKRNNKKVMMITGDSHTTALEVAQTLGIDEVHSQCLPENKYAIVSSIKNRDKNTRFFILHL